MRTLASLALIMLAATGVRAAEAGSTNAPVDYEVRVKDRPVLQRGFLPDSSPRSIAVGLPGGLSYCFDAEACRLRYAWSGGFLDMKPTWHGRGASPPVLRGEKFFIAPDALPLRVRDRAAKPKVQFRGYSMVDGLPEFRFAVDGVAVRERIEAAPGGGLRCTFEMEQPVTEIEFQPPPGTSVSSAGRTLNPNAEGWVRIPLAAPTRFEVLIPGPAAGIPVRSATKATNER